MRTRTQPANVNMVSSELVQCGWLRNVFTIFLASVLTVLSHSFYSLLSATPTLQGNDSHEDCGSDCVDFIPFDLFFFNYFFFNSLM